MTAFSIITIFVLLIDFFSFITFRRAQVAREDLFRSQSITLDCICLDSDVILGWIFIVISSGQVCDSANLLWRNLFSASTHLFLSLLYSST